MKKESLIIGIVASLSGHSYISYLLWREHQRQSWEWIFDVKDTPNLDIKINLSQRVDRAYSPHHAGTDRIDREVNSSYTTLQTTCLRFATTTMAADDQSNAAAGLTLPNSVSGKPVQAAWSTPLQPADDPNAQSGSNSRPTISDAVASIKTEDFANVAGTPCSRNGFMTGIVTGAAAGGLKLVVRGMRN